MKSAGLVLAAGAGRRMGTPKALVRDAAGVTWAARTARLLTEAGCSPVVVVVGAAADQVRAELSGEPVEVVEATDWNEGMGASLRAGLRSADAVSEAVVVLPVDVPGVTVDAVRRVVDQAGDDALVRATYDGAPGHPVVIGRDHWDGVIASARGDEGARGYLREHDVVLVECGDVADGVDVDTVGELPPGHG
ncbi:nucleotidyltransferase family protein [Kribbella sindirgiensis]|uniref:Nucleotidyltransferase family protein n=1 Tax=Kribbella sindirgiensis TaxID=1124744 RepID=A0A4R0IL44_9ACTN|nr:nucleotidyltransferase family protein [Kribbella sindirgiensis]TCC33497.1 nucleotidyltransferase family protein [Kribbella sindirgiensis]